LIGSLRSLNTLIEEMHRSITDPTYTSSNIENMTKEDAMQFPIFAGGTLCALYFAMKYFGKEVVNQFLLVYIAFGSTQGVKSLINTVTFDSLSFIDGPIIQFKNKYTGEIRISFLDIICFCISLLMMAGYVHYKSWMFNNAICIVFCIFALQTAFIGTFQIGMLLLVLLFFYDIFFVFGTDVMLTVAKDIDAPIKLMFPTDLSADPPKHNILGLGDIVIPGIFVSLCLRFDVLKTIDLEKLKLYKEKASQNKKELLGFLNFKAKSASKHYFTAVMIGYLVAIISTIAVMLVFEHG